MTQTMTACADNFATLLKNGQHASPIKSRRMMDALGIMLERSLGIVHRRTLRRRLEFDAASSYQLDEDKSHHVLIPACKQPPFNCDMPWTMCAANRFSLQMGRPARDEI